MQTHRVGITMPVVTVYPLMQEPWHCFVSLFSAFSMNLPISVQSLIANHTSHTDGNNVTFPWWSLCSAKPGS